MIIFCGELSKDSTKYLINRLRIIIFLSFFIPCLCFSIPFIVLIFVIDWIFILAVIVLICTPFLAFLPVTKKDIISILPECIKINKDNLICYGKNFTIERDFINVLKVIDYGNWFQIFFKLPHKTQSFICQKDLIVKGSIEEFEKLFQGKIKKVKKHD